MPILARYRDRVCCFNDDIQGTAAVAVAGILAALRILKSRIVDQTFLFFGAGSAGTGIADLLTKTMMQEGVPETEARARCWLFDSKGLVTSGRAPSSPTSRRPTRTITRPCRTSSSAIEAIRPTAIIGVSTIAKAFDQRVIEAMARINERPIIFPVLQSDLALRVHGGRGIRLVARSRHLRQRQPVRAGRTTTARRSVPGQGNNVYIFPAVGMAVYATEAKRVTDEMFISAARAVAEQVTDANLEAGLIYPPLSGILATSLHVAGRVAETIFDAGLAGVGRPGDLRCFLKNMAYRPEYRSLI